MLSVAMVLRHALGVAVALLLGLLVGCAGTVRHDPRVQGDLSRLDGVGQVAAVMSPDAAKQQVDNPQFNREEIATRLRHRLDARGLTAPTATHRVEIVVTDIRVRGAFAAIMFGAMAGDDHITGRVRVLDPNGRALRSLEVNASYAFGGIAGGQDSVRMNWLYDKFAELASVELEKFVTAPRAGAGPILAAAPTLGAPTSIDNVEALPLSERGRTAYREWLAQKAPRAFIISENGYFYPTYGTRPPNPNEPTDPAERAMKRCVDAARPSCTIYAQDDRVVYTRPAATAPH